MQSTYCNKTSQWVEGQNLEMASLNIHTCEVKEYFALEIAHKKSILSPENQKAIEILENTCVKKNQQVEVSLLWKYDNPEFHFHFISLFHCNTNHNKTNVL